MLYVRLACSFPNDPKVVEAGDLGELLYIRSLLYCRENLTDGVIDRRLLSRVAVGISGDPGEHAVRLVAAGLWVEHDHGWAIPLETWTEWNPTKADVVAERRREAERKKAYRDSKRSQEASEDVPQMSHRDTGGTFADSGVRPRQPEPEPEPELLPPAAAEAPGSSNPSVTAGSRRSGPKVNGHVKGAALRAVPSTPPVPAGPPSGRGTRLPDSWPLTDDLRAMAGRLSPDVDIELEHAKFLDYWHAKAGRDGTKTDWPATWRNWIRNARPPARAASNGKGRTNPDNYWE